MGRGPYRSILLATVLAAAFASAEVVCGTWNLKWFPSGRSEHRASAAMEAANVAAAAAVVRDGLRARAATDVILFFQELRDEAACTRLVDEIARTNLAVVVVTAFRDWDRRLEWQQCGIATTLPVVEASWSYWRHPQKVFPPRGYAYVVLDGGAMGLIACFCVHLKSNYAAYKPEIRLQNARKREVAAEQLVALTKDLRSRDGRRIARIVIAGDFNVDPYAKQFGGEKTCALLKTAGFVTGWDSLPSARRATHPASGRYPDATLDFIFHRGFASSGEPVLGPAISLSDHRMVWQTLGGK